jgi:hypothetical protein
MLQRVLFLLRLEAFTYGRTDFLLKTSLRDTCSKTFRFVTVCGYKAVRREGGGLAIGGRPVWAGLVGLLQCMVLYSIPGPARPHRCWFRTPSLTLSPLQGQSTTSVQMDSKHKVVFAFPLCSLHQISCVLSHITPS